MGTENTLELSNGTLYMMTDNDAIPFNIGTATIASWPQPDPEFDDEIVRSITTTGEFTFTMDDVEWDKWLTYNLTYDINWLFGGTKMLHLAKHNKKRRTRKKNRNRIIKTIERAEKYAQGYLY
jgi:hypothetical protein